jgi:hypothetical protein
MNFVPLSATLPPESNAIIAINAINSINGFDDVMAIKNGSQRSNRAKFSAGSWLPNIRRL